MPLIRAQKIIPPAPFNKFRSAPDRSPFADFVVLQRLPSIIATGEALTSQYLAGRQARGDYNPRKLLYELKKVRNGTGRGICNFWYFRHAT